MRRAVVSLLAVVTLAACGSSSKDTADSTTTASTIVVTTTLAGANGGAEATTPPTSSSGGTTLAISAPSGPVITSISGPPPVNVCSDAPNVTTPIEVALKWSTTGATSVNIAIDTEGGVFKSDLPASGETTVPLPCAGNSNTYFVIALGPNGTRVVKSLTTQGQ